MKEKLLNIASRAKSIISSITCDYMEVKISTGISTSIHLSGKNVDTVSSGESIGGSIRILNDGAWGFVSFNNMNKLEKLAERCLKLSKGARSSIKSGIVKLSPVNKEIKTSVIKDFNDISIDEKFNLISSYNNILNSSKLVQTTNSLYRDRTVSYIFLNSEGSEIIYDKSFCGISLSSVAKDGAVIQPFHNSVSGYGGYEIVENREVMAEDIVKTAVDLLKAESVNGGKYDVIVDQKLAGVFIHEAFGHLSEADFVHENENLKNIMVLGKKFGPEELNVVDDGNMDRLSGYIPADDEGVLPEKTYLIKNGELTGRLHSRETAYKMNENTTGNGRSINVMRQPIVRMTNTFIENGDISKEEIFESVDKGIYAVDVIGGQTNLEMFTFTSGYGYEINNGKPGKMYKDIVLSGNVFETLKNIKKIAFDRKMFGGLGGCGKEGQAPLPVSFGGPHMLIQDVLIGGKQ